MFLTMFDNGDRRDARRPDESGPVVASHRTPIGGKSMSILITGASGHLGRLVVDQLLAAGTPSAQIVATGRDLDKLIDLADRGVTVRRADFTEPASLDHAF